MNRKSLIIYLALVFAFVFIKASIVPFTHDECQSYTIFAEHSSQGNTANNHWLNTWSAYPLYLLFGESELAMRLPNLLVFILYLFYCFKFTQRFQNIEVQWLCIVLLTAFPFMLDFFGMMRGYGMSLGFGLGALFYFTEWVNDVGNRKNFEWTLYLSLLAVLANFTTLIFHVASVSIMGFFLLQEFKLKLFTAHFKRLLLRPLLVNIVVLSAAIYWVLFLKSRNQLYYGSDIGLFKGSFQSLVMAFFYKSEMAEGQSYMHWVMLFCSVIFIALLIGLWFKKANKSLYGLSLFSILLCAVPIALHYSLDFKYPLDRGVLIFYVPLVMLLPYGLQYIANKGKVVNVVAKAVTTVVIVAWLFNFARGANLTYFCMWKYDADVEHAVKQMKGGVDSVSIACDWKLEPSVNFYRKKLEVRARKPTKTENIENESFSFYYVFSDTTSRLSNQKIVLLQSYPISGTELYKGGNSVEPVNTTNK
jgi:hypothetical protein